MTTLVLDPEELGTFAGLNTDGTLTTPARLSFSSISQLSECGEQWRLTRGFKQGANAWWANVGGSTVHEMTEVLDRIRLGEGLPEPAWEEVFAKHEANYEGVELVPSGKKGLTEYSFAGGPEGKDREWWMTYGPQMVAAYQRKRDEWEGEYEILEIEMAFEVVIGDEVLRGHIDRLELHLPTGTIVLRDLKTGSSGNYLQLAMYREGLRIASGGLLVADFGDLIKFEAVKEKRLVPVLNEDGTPALYQRDTKTAKKGDPKMEERLVDVGVTCYAGRPTDFTGHTSQFIEMLVRNARTVIEAGAFLPNLRNNCRYCGVSQFCRAYGGEDGLLYPVETVLTSGKELSSPGVSQV